MKTNLRKIFLNFVFSILITIGIVPTSLAEKIKATKSKVYFKSEAPLEIISAESTKLKGVIDTDNKTFGFKINMNSFEGFNSPLQLQHYNENYLETEKYPEASFYGNLLDPIDLSKKGTQAIRVSGKFILHGVKKEKIFIGEFTISPQGKIMLKSKIDLSLSEFGIEIPRIVHYKIAEIIQIDIQCEFTKM